MALKSNRRAFLKTSAVAAASAYATRLLPAATSATPRLAVKTPLQVFSYSAVTLHDGPMRQQFDQNHALFLALDEDRMLKVFRQVAGQSAPGEDMGGWYDLTGFDLVKGDFHGFVPGHSFGQYLSGLARAYAVTGSEPTRLKVNRLVKGYAATLDAQANFFDGYRLPAYTYDKISCGLIDAHEFAHDPMAMEVHEKLTRAVLRYLPEKALSRAEQRGRPHKDESYTWDESYTLPENFFLAYQRSGNVLYRELGIRFLEDDSYFGPLSKGVNVLPGEHAYSHLNAFSSAMQAYLHLGSETHLYAASNGFDMVEAQSYATGGWGPSEAFVEPGKGKLGESLTTTHASFETPCGAYGHFKIARYLLRATKQPRYGDSMERVLYNTILGAKPILADGTSFYYSDCATTGKKVYSHDKWPCCSGTFPQLAADYHISVFMRSDDGVYVNLFTPSTLRWQQGGAQCELRQETHYPNDGAVEIRIIASKPVEYTLHLRIPAWAGPHCRLAVNGKRIAAPVQAGTLAAIRRTWKTGERVELELDLPLRLEPVDAQHPNLVALMRGPLVLMAVADVQPSFTREELLRSRPASNGASDWLAVSTSGSTVIMRPYVSIQDENYSTYVQLKG